MDQQSRITEMIGLRVPRAGLLGRTAAEGHRAEGN